MGFIAKVYSVFCKDKKGFGKMRPSFKSIKSGKVIIKDTKIYSLSKKLSHMIMTGWHVLMGMALVMVDYDGVLDRAAILDFHEGTAIEESGGDGIHAYYWVKCLESMQPGNLTHPKLTAFGAKLTDGIDIRGKNGLSYCAPTRFLTGFGDKPPHKHAYRWLTKCTPKTITLEEYIEIHDQLIDTEMKLSPTTGIFTCATDWVLTEREMRGGFIAILNGTLNLDGPLPAKKADIHLYWQGFWRECLTTGRKFDEVCYELESTQTGFDYAKAKYQLKYINKLPVSKDFYCKLFPKHLLQYHEKKTKNWQDDFLTFWAKEIEPRFKFRYCNENKQKQWYLYDTNKFCHVKTDVSTIDGLIFFWCENNFIEKKEAKNNLLIRQLKSTYKAIETDYNQEKEIIALKDGIYDTDDKCYLKESPAYFNKYQIPRKILETYDVKMIETFLLHLKEATDDWIGFINYMAAVAQNIPLPYCVILVGRPSFGKSPYLTCANFLFGTEIVGVNDMDKLGEKSGMNLCYDRKLNIDADMDMEFLYSETISKIKKIFGGDRMVPVRLLFQGPFQWEVFLKMMAATNQCPKVAQGADVDGVYKRTDMIRFNKQRFEDDDDFTDHLKEDVFLDNLFTYLMQYKVVNARKVMGVDDWIKRTRDIWEDSAYPTLAIIKAKYERSFDIADYVLRGDVVKYVAEHLHERGITPASNIVSQITETIHLLGGDKCMKDKNEAYLGIKEIDEKTTKSTDEIDETEMVTDEDFYKFGKKRRPKR